jgi:ribosomal protein S12 methylthiotransferase
MIAGHPGETEEDFSQLMSFIEKSRFERLGIFNYSHEENTHAYSMADDVPAEMKQERADAVMELQQGISLEINQQRIGNLLKVLVDRKEGNNYVGRSEYDSPEVDNEVIIHAPDDYLRTGDFIQVKITGATEFDLTGVPVQ